MYIPHILKRHLSINAFCTFDELKFCLLTFSDNEFFQPNLYRFKSEEAFIFKTLDNNYFRCNSIYRSRILNFGYQISLTGKMKEKQINALKLSCEDMKRQTQGGRFLRRRFVHFIQCNQL